MSEARRKRSDMFSKDEIALLTQRSNTMGALAVGFTWAAIAACLVVLAMWPHPLVWLAVIVILGGRQLSLAILMHDASHGTLFQSRALNDFVGDYLCGAPVGIALRHYRRHHLAHHAHTGTAADTDTSLSAPFPTTPASLARKFLRDLLGISGLKREFGLLLMGLGIVQWTVASDIVKLAQEGRTLRHYATDAARNLWKPFAFHALLLGTLALAGYAWVYLAWLAAYLTTYSLYMRIRSMAEHACTAPGPDMLRNTRSTRAGLLARATVAPLRVNFHIEHHVLPAVPYFRLKHMHALLRQRELVPPPPGYLDVLRLVSRV